MSNKKVNNFSEDLQTIELPQPLFYKRRLSSVPEIKEFASNTTFIVLSDPVGILYGHRKFVFCECIECGCRKHVGITDLKNKTVTCDSCSFHKMKEVAKTVDLELISLIENDNHRNLYKFKDCGHIRKIRRDAVVSGFFKCNECYENEISALVLDSNYTMECDFKDFTYKASPYKCKSCGFIENKTFSAIKSKAACLNCIKLNLQNHLLDNNIELVTEFNAVYSDYKLPCGHIQSIQKHKMLSGAYRCRQCHKDELLVLAKNCELTLDINDRKDHRYYCKLKCGCSQYVKGDELRRGRVYCKTHDRTRMSSPSLVYLLEIESKGFIFLKLGFSLDLDKRIVGYKLAEGSRAVKLAEIKTKNGFIANKLENSVHDKFTTHNLDKSLMLNYMISGYTECYPFTLKDEILAELHKLKEVKDLYNG